MSCQGELSKLLLWRRRAPKCTTFRVNSLVTTPSDVMEILNHGLQELSEKRIKAGLDSIAPQVWNHSSLPEVVAFGNWSRDSDLPRYESEVIVDCACGSAVLRGAHVFAPGVIGLMPGSERGKLVSIYVDVGKKCKRGWTQKLNENDRVFVGNGILLLDRKQIFGDNAVLRGIAVEVIDNESGCPALPVNLLSPGMAVMQNFPSIVCGRVVDPQPGELILDLCAAPGNKTTHMAALMKNEGNIIALDRSASRIKKLQQLCKDCGVKNVTAFVCDSVYAVQSEEWSAGNNQHLLLERGPPFPAHSFDRILLDAPCSGLGQRPKLELVDLKHAASFPPLQRKLFSSAVKLLKPGGILVYSTCTVLAAENEEIVRWALDQFPCLELLRRGPNCFHPLPGLDSSNSNLSSEERNCLLKFDPSQSEIIRKDPCENDTIGFFIAQFQKKIK